ncbi:MAG TPA: GNAT family N-acetyltransferase [Nitrospirae bacterium]|nr:GNAT family N-acetyltransferase [Nitrospirota bacterium]
MLWVKMPRYMKANKLRLRPLSIFDDSSINKWLRNKVILKTERLSKPACLSWFFLWWWVKRRFTCSFCIEIDSRSVGFIALYNMRLGKSAEITLMIFESIFKRHGYGTMAFKFLAQNLQRHAVVEKVFARVEADNHTALSFWRSLGFMEVSSLEGITNLSLDLNGWSGRWGPGIQY